MSLSVLTPLATFNNQLKQTALDQSDDLPLVQFVKQLVGRTKLILVPGLDRGCDALQDAFRLADLCTS